MNLCLNLSGGKIDFTSYFLFCFVKFSHHANFGTKIRFYDLFPSYHFLLCDFSYNFLSHTRNTFIVYFAGAECLAVCLTKVLSFQKIVRRGRETKMKSLRSIKQLFRDMQRVYQA